MRQTRTNIIKGFKSYCDFFMQDIDEFNLQWYQYRMIDQIEKVISGKLPPRLGMFLPPRHGKTLIGGDFFLSYMFGIFPDKVGVYATYNEELALQRRNSLEKIITSERYEWLFPHTRIKSRLNERQLKAIKAKKAVRNTNFEISNAKSSTGKLIFVGRGSTLTGIPMHYGACDDLYKNEGEGISENINATIFNWFLKVFMSRVDRKDSIVILFYTRWVEDDVGGRLVEYNNDAIEKNINGFIPWSFLRFPAYKDDLNDNPLDTRKLGEPLDKDREYAYAQARMDDATFEALYQQHPPKKGHLCLFNKIEFRYYTALPTLSYIVISLDTTFKGDSKTVDRTAFTIWGTHGRDIYMYPFFISKKMDFHELEQSAVLIVQKVINYFVFLIEDSASGAPLASRLKHQVDRVRLWPVNGKSKRERGQYAYPYLATGRVFFPDPYLCPQIKEAIDQFRNFTGLEKNELDDIPDTFFQTLQFYDECGIFRRYRSIQVTHNPLLLSGKFRPLIPQTKTQAIYLK